MRHPLANLSRRDIVAFSLLAVSCVFLFSTFALVQSAAPQASKRSFESKIPSQVPLKIKIKKEKEEKALDVNNKNWFKDIEIEVTNTSDKPIYFLSLDIVMPDVRTDRDIPTTFPLRFGRTDFYEHNTTPIPEDPSIQPKATYTFAFEANNKIGYEAWRDKNNKKDPLRLEVWFSHLSFGDGTGFTSLSGLPFPFKNDPKELGRCLEKERPPDLWAKIPATFSHLYAENLKTPAATLPVNLSSENYVTEANVIKSVVAPDICCPGTSCNKFKFSKYQCVCASDVQTVLTTPCTDPVGVCGTQVELAPLCNFQGTECPRFAFIVCESLLPIPTPTPTPVFTCPSTFPGNCESGIPVDPCNDEWTLNNGCPDYYHPVGACCVKDQCFYEPIVCPLGSVQVEFGPPICKRVCIQVPQLPELGCTYFGFLWSSLAGACRATAPVSQTDCDDFAWFWNPISDFCQSDAPPPCEIFPEVCDPGSWSFDWCGCVPYNTPILIDVAGNGFDLTGSTGGVDFNLNNRGGSETVAWTKANTDDAWLVLDRNGNGTIDNGTELFGDVSPQPEPTGGGKKNGFRALAEYDKRTNGGNADGRIESRDAVFSSLRLWQDKNHNGLSESNELHTLLSLNVAVVELEYQESKKTDSNGNQFRYRAKIKNTSGRQLGRWAWDIYLVKAM